VDRIVGPQTWNHLVNGYLAAPDPQTAQDVFSGSQARCTLVVSPPRDRPRP
jgi:hypothetical protein